MLQDTYERLIRPEDVTGLETRIWNALSSSINSKKKCVFKGAEEFIGFCRKNNSNDCAQEPWPQLIKLYQPFEVEQILLPDNANCLAVQAFLHMCNLEYQIEPRKNAEFMSPSGRVPFIQCGAFLIADFDNIVTFIGNKGSALSSDLSPDEKADMRAYMSLINYGLANAEQYVCWVDPTVNAVTNSRHGSVYPWPLNHILNWQKQRQITKKLKVLGLYNKTIDEVYHDVKMCCTALSDRLDGKLYFYGDKPTELEALIYGHIQAILNVSSFPTMHEINSVVTLFPDLIELCERIDIDYINNNYRQTINPDDLGNCFGEFSRLTVEYLGPKELDALVFGHLYTILTTPLPGNKLAEIVHNHPDLVNLCKRIETRYFGRTTDE